MLGSVLMEIDTSVVDGLITDLGTAVVPVIGGALGVAATVFGVLWLWRRGKKAVGS